MIAEFRVNCSIGQTDEQTDGCGATLSRNPPNEDHVIIISYFEEWSKMVLKGDRPPLDAIEMVVETYVVWVK